MNISEVPIGFGLALAKSETAMNAFAMMTKEEKQSIWSKARSARSAQEMNDLISEIASNA